MEEHKRGQAKPDKGEASMRDRLAAIEQRSMGKRELAYSVMRMARIVIGWPIVAAGFYIMLDCMIRSGVWCMVSRWSWAAGYALLAVLGVGVIFFGLALTLPYQFDTFLEEVMSERKCMRCGHPSPPKEVFAACDRCGAWFPLDVRTYLGRMLGRSVTIVQILLLGFIFYFSRI